MQVRISKDVVLFVRTLEEGTAAKIVRTMELLPRYGSKLRVPHSKYIQKGLYELRVPGRQEIRIFYTIRSGEALLLHGFIKKSKRIPKYELETAVKRMWNISIDYT